MSPIGFEKCVSTVLYVIYAHIWLFKVSSERGDHLQFFETLKVSEGSPL